MYPAGSLESIAQDFETSTYSFHLDFKNPFPFNDFPVLGHRVMSRLDFIQLAVKFKVQDVVAEWRMLTEYKKPMADYRSPISSWKILSLPQNEGRFFVH